MGFAIALLSPDDTGYSNRDGANEAKPRARQNVVLELGYFVGKLGRDRVLALKRGHVEVASDLAGVAYTDYDAENWQIALVRRIASGWVRCRRDKLS